MCVEKCANTRQWGRTSPKLLCDVLAVAAHHNGTGSGLLHATTLQIIEFGGRCFAVHCSRANRRGGFELTGLSGFAQRLNERLVGRDGVVVAERPEIAGLTCTRTLCEGGTVYLGRVGTEVGRRYRTRGLVHGTEDELPTAHADVDEHGGVAHRAGGVAALRRGID